MKFGNHQRERCVKLICRSTGIRYVVMDCLAPSLSKMEATLALDQEFHAFEVDAAIVSDLIYRQNGTISTAFRELVMNAFDANSETVDILIWREGFEVKDSGDGFEDEASIMRNFKRFGTPHKEGDVPYGRFRIGRGQIMAFAKTTWYSKNFQMVTDVRSKDAGFVFHKDALPYEGCRVFGEFYEPLDSQNVRRATEDLTQLVRYSPWPVFINQVQVNTQDGIKWDYEDDKIKIVFNPKGNYGIHLYSLGVLVKELQMHRYGISADVVTKSALQLNMARNEINEHDPLWLHVHKVLREELRKRQTGKNKVGESERLALIDEFRCEEIGFMEIVKLPLLKDVRGKVTSFYTQITKHRPWTVSEDSQARIADMVSTQGNAFVIPRSELDIWRVRTIEQLIAVAQENFGRGDNGYVAALLREVDVVPFETISKGVNDKYTLIAITDLSPIEKAQRNALQYTAANIGKRLEKLHGEVIGKRKVHIGISHAIAWTDSSTYIAFNRKSLTLFENGMPGLTLLAATLLHEFMHTDGSIGSNDHDMAFYEGFHDSILASSAKHEVLGNAVSSLRNQYKSELEKLNLPYPKWMEGHSGSTITVSLLAKTPPPLLTWFLDLVDLPPVIGRGKIELNASIEKMRDFPQKVHSRIDAIMRKHHIPVLALDDFDHLSDYDQRHEEYMKARLPHVKAALEKEGFTVTDLTAEIISNYRPSSWRRPFSGLSALTDDEAFGVKSLHAEHQRTVKSMAGKGFTYQSNFDPDWGWRDVTAETFADGGKEMRFAHYKKTLEQLVNGILDPVARAEFVERVFNEKMTKSLNLKKI